MTLRFDVISVLPEYLTPFIEHGVCSRAIRRGLAEVRAWNPRQFTNDVHQTVDDRPYGGGPGMVMLAQPLADTVRAVRDDLMRFGVPPGPVILMSPQGEPLSDAWVRRTLSGQQSLVSAGAVQQMTLVCGRYEGVDQRFIDRYVTQELSLGDFVLSGGEIAALAVMDALIRCLPGALGSADSAAQDSFVGGLLDHPHYTRPECFENLPVPEVLLSGHHGKISDWRKQAAVEATRQKRPDLLIPAGGHESEG